MSRPTMEMMSSTDPADESCDATFTVGDKTWTLRVANRQAFTISGMITAAYNEGRVNGRTIMATEMKNFIRNLSRE